VTCREFSDFIGDYLAGELPVVPRTSFEKHLAVCENCRRYLAQYQQSIELGRRAYQEPDAVVPDDVPDELVAAILVARQRGSL
jgi:predicted anti-sigma-YlaC factor YlaD